MSTIKGVIQIQGQISQAPRAMNSTMNIVVNSFRFSKYE